MESPHRIPVSAPVLGERAKELVIDCLDSTWISSAGKYITAFEQRFAEFTGSKHAIACCNGTTALHLALVGMGLKPGDEVIVPALTYIATANAVSYCGATPVFADCDARTLTLCPESVRKNLTAATRGIIPVHLYGHPADMDEINALALSHGLWVVEDAAEAHGAEYKGRRVGTLGDCGVFSFFGNKIITTGEGGMITCDNDELAARLRLHRGQGMDLTRRYWHPVIGFNYRMTNIAAAIGVAQMERISTAIAARKRVAATYAALLAPLSAALVLPATASWAHHAYWMYTVFINDIHESQRDNIITFMDHHGIETRPVFYPVNAMPPYLGTPGEVPVTKGLAARGLNLPTHELLTSEDQARVIDVLRQAMEMAHSSRP